MKSILLHASQAYTALAALAADVTSVDLNGTDEHMQSAQQSIGVTSTVSMMIWFKPDALTVRMGLMGLRNTVNSAARIDLTIRGDQATNNLLLLWFDSEGTPAQIKNLQYHDLFSTDTWFMVVATMNAATQAGIVYLNADGALTPDSEAGTSINVPTDVSRSLQVGSETIGGGTYFSGDIHSTAIWSSVLTPAEIVEIYNSGVGGTFDLNADSGNYASSATLEHWHRIGHNTGNIGKDDATSPGGAGALDLTDAAVNITEAGDITTSSPGV